MRRNALRHEFVDSAPSKLEEGVLYISVRYATVLHKCCCGCANEIVMSLSPARWRLTFDGETVSLYPSVGNWGLPCESHYWIERNKVRWAGRWSAEEVEAARAADRLARQAHFAARSAAVDVEAAKTAMPLGKSKRSFWAWIAGWWSK